MPEVMADLLTLIEQEIPEGRQNLQDSHSNLEKVAEYCETNYFTSENKRAALEETKNYTTQSLASVAYQINTLAYNLLHMLDLQTTQMAEMESQINHIAQTVMIHKEKVARREIGILTTNKSTTRQHKILAPANPERPIKYIRKPIDYTVLDDVGHGLRSSSATGNTPRARRTPSQISGAALMNAAVHINGGNPATAGPAPTTKPPTPPQTVRSVGSLSRGSREYRTPAPPIAPPTVPSNYAPNYPLGHPRSQEARRGSGYSTLPPMHGHHQQPQLHHTMAAGHSQHYHAQHHSHLQSLQGGPAHHGTLQHHSQYQQHHMVAQQPSPLPPQIGMVHPLTHQNHPTLPPAPTPPPPPDISTIPSSRDRDSLPDPPPPLGLEDFDRSVSPPLPPPPSTSFPEDDHHGVYGGPDSHHYPPPSPPGYAPRGRANSEDSASGIPKTYIEKVIAIYDYHADKEDELSFSENSLIYVVKKNDDGWYEGVLEGVTGLFPGNYVEPCM